MTYSEAAIKGAALGLFMAISVGPTLFAVIKYSIHHSYKAGIAFILGVSFSDIIYVTMANIASSWLTFLEAHGKTVGYLGSLVFIVIGLIGLLKKYKPKKPNRENKAMKISKKAYLQIWLSGFLMNSLNPGVVIVWLGAAAVIAGPEVNASHKITLFGVCLGLVLSIDILKVFLADKIRHKLTLRKIMYINKISAACILGLGLVLLFQTYFDIVKAV
ncbi:MAG TPA: LysE family transporter [Edaphocola sp.]|nr:LysE family transporter [Edaphocola sp.]